MCVRQMRPPGRGDAWILKIAHAASPKNLSKTVSAPKRVAFLPKGAFAKKFSGAGETPLWALAFGCSHALVAEGFKELYPAGINIKRREFITLLGGGVAARGEGAAGGSDACGWVPAYRFVRSRDLSSSQLATDIVAVEPRGPKHGLVATEALTQREFHVAFEPRPGRSEMILAGPLARP
jgi:hypothetical protein